MNLKEIKELITLMNENDLTELEIEKEGSKIKLKKSPLDVAPVYSPPAMEYRPEPLPAHKSTEALNNQIPSGKNTKMIVSPMVGTFYRSPSPEAPSFIDVGQIVEIGQVVCIVEAMKLMNEIKSEIRGKVSEISVENAEPVEFGQTLFVIEPL